MKTSICKILNNFSAGFVVLLLVSIALFWGRFYCDEFLFIRMDYPYKEVEITPSALLPPNVENDPNVCTHSFFTGSLNSPEIPDILSLGIAEYFLQMMGRLRGCSCCDTTATLDFDKDSGLFIYQNTYAIRAVDNNSENKTITLYAGPEGIGQTPSKELGRFVAPLRTEFECGCRRSAITYDNKLRHFYKLDFEKGAVTKGPEMKKEDKYVPVQIGPIQKGYDITDLWWSPTRKKVKGKKPDEEPNSWVFKSTVDRYSPFAGQYTPVLDQTGRILLVNGETLDISGIAGYLPAPNTFFDTGRTQARPKDLLAFKIEPIALKPDGKYLGMGIAALSREGTSMKVVVFDSNGTLLKEKSTGFKGRLHYYPTNINKDEVLYADDINMDSSKAVFWGKPGSPTVTILRFIFENLQGPILSITSYFTADTFEASSGHRALFLLPNSFIAMKGRQTDANPIRKFFTALLLILPSIILSIFLARSVNRDAASTGLSKNAKQWWVIGVAAFGLPGYISYRLTRPKITLVTCQNCGNGRRPDMETCHRCGSKWFVPELVPPAWRVADADDKP